MSAGRPEKPLSGPPNNSTQAVNRFAPPDWDLTRAELAWELAARAAARDTPPRAPTPKPRTSSGRRRPWLEAEIQQLARELAARAEARAAARVAAHEDRRRAALDGLAALDTLPRIHAAAAWRLAQQRVPGLPEADELRGAVLRSTRHGAPAVLAAAEAAGRVLASLAPPREEADADGVRLARGDEAEIAALAEEYAVAGRVAQEVVEWARARVPEKQRTPDPEPWIREERACPRWWRRRLRRSAKRAQVWFDTALRLPRVGSSPHVSNFTLAAHRQRQANARAWADGQAVRFEDGSVVPLSEIQHRARTARRATTYAILKGMEHHGQAHDYAAFFITLTLPGAFHAVIKGAEEEDGSYPHAHPNPDWTPKHGPAAAWRALSKMWDGFRSQLAKHRPLRAWFGISVPEPHHDGTPHLHALVWLPSYFTDKRGRRRGTGMVLKGILRRLAPGPQSRLEIVRKRPDRMLPDGRVRRFLSPASYVMKYVTADALDDDEAQAAAGESGERHRAWASSRGIRRMRLVGAHGSLRIWQRLWTSPDDEELPERAALARAAMRRSAAAGVRAVAAEPDSDERADARREQAAAAAEALGLIGALPGATRKFRLGYDDTVTSYGRPTRRAARVEEHEMVEDTDERGRVRQTWVPTGASFPLRRQAAQLVDLPREQETAQEAVTVAASCPREAAGAASPDAPDAVAGEMERLIQARERLQQWQGWCAERRRRLDQLRGLPWTAFPTRRRPLMMMADEAA